MKFGSPIQTRLANQHRHGDGIREGNSDVGGRQRTLSVCRLVFVGIVFVRAFSIRVMLVVVSMVLVNHPGILEQRMRRGGQPEGRQEQRYDCTKPDHSPGFIRDTDDESIVSKLSRWLISWKAGTEDPRSRLSRRVNQQNEPKVGDCHFER